MNDERFERLFQAAHKYAHASGDNLTERSKARRQYRQTLDVIQAEATPEQWGKVESAIAKGWPTEGP